jgi:hypothetical protein
MKILSITATSPSGVLRFTVQDEKMFGTHERQRRHTLAQNDPGWYLHKKRIQVCKTFPLFPPIPRTIVTVPLIHYR